MKYQIFITTCTKSQVNGLNRILIGLHEASTDYLGEGVYASQASSFMYPKTPFQEAVKHYGINAFVKTVLLESEDYNYLYNIYRYILNEDMIKQSHVYNWQEASFQPDVYQFDQKGNFIKKWNTEILRFLNLLNFTL